MAADDDGARRTGSEPADTRPTVAIIYHMFPHYRGAVIEALQQSRRYRYVFAASDEAFDGIKPLPRSAFGEFVPAPFSTWRRLLIQPRAVSLSASRRFAAIILLGNPNYPTTWAAALVARLRGVPVLFWMHGWLRREKGPKRWLRTAFARLANRSLVYGPRAARIGAEEGLGGRIRVVYNSLDHATSTRLFEALDRGDAPKVDPRSFFAERDRPLLIYIGRLIDPPRLDQLLDAAAALAPGLKVNILLVGDGHRREPLAAQAAELGLDVHCFGACYDEEVIAGLLYHADLLVSPGKIGLTAMHALSYGTPVVTHGDMDAQMPEVEAIEEGKTGLFFTRGDVRALADAIRSWLETAPDRESVRRACRAAIAANWTPERQREEIEAALDEVVRHR